MTTTSLMYLARYVVEPMVLVSSVVHTCCWGGQAGLHFSVRGTSGAETKELEAKSDMIVGLKTFVQRSTWRLVPEQQVFEVATASSFRIADAALEFFENINRKLMSAQVVGDGFNTCKATVPHQNQMGSTERHYYQLISQNIASTKHGLDELHFAFAPLSRDQALPKHSHRAPIATAPA